MKANSLEAGDCKVLLSLQTKKEKPVLQIDLLTDNFDSYEAIQQGLGRMDIDFLEHYYEPTKATVTHFEIEAKLTLHLFDTNPGTALKNDFVGD